MEMDCILKKIWQLFLSSSLMSWKNLLNNNNNNNNNNTIINDNLYSALSKSSKALRNQGKK